MSQDHPAEPDPHSANADLLNLHQVAQRLGVDCRFVRRLVHERRIAYVKVGRLVRFDPNELADWVEANRVQPRRRDRTA